jgi:hypothetical protein
MTAKKEKEEKVEIPENWTIQKTAYYASLRTAWHANRQSSTKSILSLSAAGIGLLVGLSNFLSFSSILQIVFFGCSIVFFVITIVFAILTWNNNADLIDIIIKKCIAPPDKQEIFKCKICKCNKILKVLDWFVYISFALAILAAIIFSSLSICNKYNQTKRGVLCKKCQANQTNQTNQN